MSYNPKLDNKSIKEVDKGLVYPVYIISRVVAELIEFCKSTAPNEALGYLIGNKIQFKEKPIIEFTKITDWVTSSVESSHISANFTTTGLEQTNRFLDDRYGLNREQNAELPHVIGIVHSHPFDTEPNFSQTDLRTFLHFPYNSKGNVFILIDPVPQIPFFKVFKIVKKNSELLLQHVPWLEYSFIESDLERTNYRPVQSNKTKSFENNSIVPLKIDTINSKTPKSSSKKKVNLREFF